MDWTRYIKRTAVRRVVWIVVGLVVYAILSAMGIAHAATWPSRGAALAECERLGAASVAVQPNLRREPAGGFCVTFPAQNPNRYMCAVDIRFGTNPTDTWHVRGSSCGEEYWTVQCPDGGTWNDDLKMCHEGCENAGPTNPPQPPFFPTDRIVPNGTAQCGPDACVRLYHNNFDGTWTGTPTGDMCTPNTPPNCSDGALGRLGYVSTPEGCMPPPTECPAGQTRDAETGGCKGGCPAGMSFNERNECKPDDNVCPAGQVKGPDGSCTSTGCPAGQARGADGTCKPDSDGDGTPDEDEDGGGGENGDGRMFSGGDSCVHPPQCSGDAIMCGQARIQWRIDCNTRRQANISGGSCEAMPVCAGEHCDAMEYAQLIQQWRSSCALQNLASGGVIGDGDGDGGTDTVDVVGIGEGAVDGASGTSGDGGNPGGAFTDGSEGGGGNGDLDTDGLGFGTSCPALPSINVLGVTLDFNEIGPTLCDWMSLGGYIVLILSSLLSLRILAGGMNV